MLFNNSNGIHIIRTLSTQTVIKETTEKESKTTHFGFETVSEEEKWKKG